MYMLGLGGIILLAGIASAGFSPAPPTIDGVIELNEWSGARRERLIGGGEVLLLRDGSDLYVAVIGAKQGYPSYAWATVGKLKSLTLRQRLVPSSTHARATSGTEGDHSSGAVAMGSSLLRRAWPTVTHFSPIIDGFLRRVAPAHPHGSSVSGSVRRVGS
jgi:hypothetical protein